MTSGTSSTQLEGFNVRTRSPSFPVMSLHFSLTFGMKDEWKDECILSFGRLIYFYLLLYTQYRYKLRSNHKIDK